VSTRLIGTLIMAHADDDGMILPPRVAPSHIVILPVTPKPETRDAVLAAAEKLASELRAQRFHGEPVVVEVDKRDLGGGVKNWEWIKKGIPVRIEIGPRDLEQGTVALARRDRSPKEKEFLPAAETPGKIVEVLQSIQDTLYARALEYRDANTLPIDTREAFDAFFTAKNAQKPEIHGGFARAHWCGSPKCEEDVKTRLKVTIRCIPFDAVEEAGTCVVCGEPSNKRVLWAKSY
jgi:prolyl-tRNA synthetase